SRNALLRPEWQQQLQLESYMKRRYNETAAEVPALEGENYVEHNRRVLFYMNMIWFMTTLLERKDRMSMGASLEVRVPFSDHRLVEYVWNVPWEMKNLNNREKGLLRCALEDVLPHDVLYRKKSPYPKTHDPNYSDRAAGWLSERLKNKDSILRELFAMQKLETLIETRGSSFSEPYFGQLMTGPQLLSYLAQFDFWWEHYRVNMDI
ncbi:MAG: asparagine synthase-related protein, partial [Bacilli bacterium]